VCKRSTANKVYHGSEFWCILDIDPLPKDMHFKVDFKILQFKDKRTQKKVGSRKTNIVLFV